MSSVRLVCVDDATCVWAHHFWINAVGMSATTISVTVDVIMGWNLFTFVQSTQHGVLVAFE